MTPLDIRIVPARESDVPVVYSLIQRLADYERLNHELEATEDDAVSILANNLPVAKGTVVVNGNRIAVEVGNLLPRSPDMR